MIGNFLQRCLDSGYTKVVDRTQDDWKSDFFAHERTRTDYAVVLGHLGDIFTLAKNAWLEPGVDRWQPLLLRPPVVVNFKRNQFNLTLAIDFDAKEPYTRVEPTEEQWSEFHEMTKSILVDAQNSALERDAFDNCVALAAWPADKRGAFGFHLMFPRVLMKRRDGELTTLPAAVCSALEEAARRALDANIVVDKAISGLRVGPSDKWLTSTKTWRGSTTTIAYCAVDFFSAADVIPMTEDDSLPLLTFERARPRRAVNRGDPIDLVELPKAAQTALEFYRAVYDPHARLQNGFPVLENGKYKFRFVDSRDHVCHHQSNNHHAELDLHTMQFSLFCYGDTHAQSARVHPWANMIQLLARLAPAAPEPMDEEDDEIEQDPILALLETLDKTTSVATQLFKRDFEYLEQEPPNWALDFHPDGLAVTVAMFNEVRNGGASNTQLAYLLSLAITHSVSSNEYLVRTGDGNVSKHKLGDVRALLAAYKIEVPTAKSTKWVAMEPHMMRKITGYMPIRWRQAPVNQLTGLPIYNTYYAKAEGTGLMLRWWMVLLDSLAAKSTSATGNPTIRHDLARWLRLWTGVVLFDHRRVGLVPFLVEPNGGAGKSLYADLLRLMLGFHQVQDWTNPGDKQREQFQNYLAMARLIVCDDADWKNTSGNVFKTMVSRTTMSSNTKHGQNGVTFETAANFLMLGNDMRLDPESFTDQERRFVVLTPGRNAPAVYPPAHEESCQRMFGRDHASFLAFGHRMKEQPEQLQWFMDMLYSLYKRDVTRVGGDVIEFLRDQVESGATATEALNNARLASLDPVAHWCHALLTTGRPPIHENSSLFEWPVPGEQSYFVCARPGYTPGVCDPDDQYMTAYPVDTLFKLFHRAYPREVNKRTRPQFTKQFIAGWNKVSRTLTGLPDEEYAFDIENQLVCHEAKPEYRVHQNHKEYHGYRVDDTNNPRQKCVRISFEGARAYAK